LVNLKTVWLVCECFEFQRQVFGTDYFIIGLARKETGQNMCIEGVPTLIGAETAPYRQTAQRQVANGVEQLVAHECIIEAQPARIEDPILMHGDGIIEAGAERIARLPQDLGVANKAKGPRPGNILVIAPWRPVEDHALAADNL